jgi:hypothetical protein
MNIYLKKFLQRGIAFGGFGPIILGIVFLVLSFTVSDFSLGGREVFLAIVSTYVLAFVQAGASVFNQIEEWPLAKCTFVHFLTLYVTYVLCYLVNTWIPFDVSVVLIFTAVFFVTYLAIWLTVFISVKAVSKRLNEKIK